MESWCQLMILIHSMAVSDYKPKCIWQIWGVFCQFRFDRVSGKKVLPESKISSLMTVSTFPLKKTSNYQQGQGMESQYWLIGFKLLASEPALKIAELISQWFHWKFSGQHHAYSRCKYCHWSFLQGRNCWIVKPYPERRQFMIRVTLAVTGSISSHKAADITSQLRSHDGSAASSYHSRWPYRFYQRTCFLGPHERAEARQGQPYWDRQRNKSFWSLLQQLIPSPNWPMVQLW